MFGLNQIRITDTRWLTRITYRAQSVAICTAVDLMTNRTILTYTVQVTYGESPKDMGLYSSLHLVLVTFFLSLPLVDVVVEAPS